MLLRVVLSCGVWETSSRWRFPSWVCRKVFPSEPRTTFHAAHGLAAVDCGEVERPPVVRCDLERVAYQFFEKMVDTRCVGDE